MLDIEFITYLFALNFGSKMDFKELKIVISKAITSFKFDKLSAKIESHSVLKIGIEYCKYLLKSVVTDPKKESDAPHFIQDVVFYYIEHEPTKCDEMPLRIKNDLKYIFASVFEGKTLSAYLSPMWVLQVIGRWLKTKSLSWSYDVLGILDSFGADMMPVDMSNMSLTKLNPNLFVYYYIQLDVNERAIEKIGSFEEKISFIKKLPRVKAIQRAVRSHFILKYVVRILENAKDSINASKDLNSLGLIKELHDIWEDSSLDNVQLYFFTLFKKDEDLIQFCKWNELMNELGLEKFVVPPEFNLDNLFYLPFMVSDKRPLYPLYISVRDLFSEEPSDIVSGVRALIGNKDKNLPFSSDVIRNAIRMMFVLVAYYDFFNKGIACPNAETAVQILQNELHLSDLELRAVTFFMHGYYTMDYFVNNVYIVKPSGRSSNENTRFDRLYSTFSEKLRTDKNDKTDLSMSHLMANVLAITLGCPKDSTHMYKRIFSFKEMGRGCCPGSSFNRNNWDCGFVIEDSDGRFHDKVPNTVIMHNIRQYRLALNTITWAAFSWAQIIEPKMYRTALEFEHFINYIGDAEMQLNGVSGTEEENVHTYVYDRACTFFGWLTHEYNTGQRVDQMHFINESLLELFNITNEVSCVKKPQAFTDLFDFDKAVEYEDEMEKIFDRVMSDIKDRRIELQGKLLASTAQLGRIMALRDFMSEHFFCSLDYNIDFFMDQLSRNTLEIDKHDDSKSLATRINFVNKFFDQKSQYAIMKHLPTVVQFYVELNKIVDYKITQTEANKLTVPGVLKKLCKSSDKIWSLWDKLKTVWKSIREVVRLDECAVAQIFEGEAAQIDDTTLICAILGFEGQDDNEGGELFRVIRIGFAKIQDDLINKKDAMMNSLENPEDDNRSEWNPFELGIEKETESIQLENLLASKDNLHPLITGEEYEGETELYVFSKMTIDKSISSKSIRFDWDIISKHIIWRYMCGKKTLDSGKALENEFKRTCHVLVDDDLEEDKESILIESFNPMRSVKSLEKFIPRLEALGLFSEPIENLQKLDKMMRSYGEAALIQICDILSIVARNILLHRDDKIIVEKTAAQTIRFVVSSVSSKIIPDTLKTVSEYPCSNIVFLAHDVLERVHTRQYLFQNLERHYTANLSDREKAFLDEFEKEIVNI